MSLNRESDERYRECWTAYQQADGSPRITPGDRPEFYAPQADRDRCHAAQAGLCRRPDSRDDRPIQPPFGVIYDIIGKRAASHSRLP